MVLCKVKWDAVKTAHIVCSRVCIMVRCLSVCLSHLSNDACCCSGFAAPGPAGRRYRLMAAAAAQRSAANASSVALSADVGSWTRMCWNAVAALCCNRTGCTARPVGSDDIAFISCQSQCTVPQGLSQSHLAAAVLRTLSADCCEPWQTSSDRLCRLLIQFLLTVL